MRLAMKVQSSLGIHLMMDEEYCTDRTQQMKMTFASLELPVGLIRRIHISCQECSMPEIIHCQCSGILVTLSDLG